jgi:hypothetical protein
MSSWTPKNYKTKIWSHYNRALKQRSSLSIWFDAEMAWEAKPSGHRGRQQAYSDAAIQACLTMKVLFGLPLRQSKSEPKGSAKYCHFGGGVMSGYACASIRAAALVI